MRQQLDEVMELLCRGGIETREFNTLFDEVMKSDRKRKRIPAPLPGDEVNKIQVRFDDASRRDPIRAAEILADLKDAHARNAELRVEKKAANKAVEGAMKRFALAVQARLLDEIQTCGEAMNEIALQHKEMCILTPAVLPDRILDLSRRARWARSVYDHHALGAKPDNKHGTQRIPVLDPFLFVRGLSLREAVKMRCSMPPTASIAVA